MEGFPKDLLYSILQLGGYKSICRASQVCRLWNKQLSDDKPIWEYWTMRIPPHFLQLPPTESRKNLWTTFHKIFRSAAGDFPRFFSLFQELKSYAEKHVGYLTCLFKNPSSRPFEEAKKLKEGFKAAKKKCPRDVMCWFLICDHLWFSGTGFLMESYYLDMPPTCYEESESDVLRICYFDSKYYFYVLDPVGKEMKTFKKGNVIWKDDRDAYHLAADSFEDFLMVILKSLTTLAYMPYDKIKKTLQDIYYRILNEPNISSGDLEILNIEYDRLSKCFDSIQEYLKEQEAFHLKWKKENEVFNREAFEGVLKNLKEMNEEQLASTLELKPDLKLLLLSPQEKYGFESVNTYNTNCSLLEQRAIYFKMGELEKDQEIVKTKMVELMETISSLAAEYAERQQMEAKFKAPKKLGLLPKTTHSKEEFLSEILTKRKRRD